MTFREFLEIKNAQAIVEHIETLSDDQARELIEQLDESTIELIEALLNEISLRKTERVTSSLEKQIARETNPIKRAKLMDRLDAARIKQVDKFRKRAKRIVDKHAVDPNTGEIMGTQSKGNENLMRAVADQNRKDPLMRTATDWVQAEKERRENLNFNVFKDMLK